MGYFSNGSEGSDYEEKYCRNCAHNATEDVACPVWLAHLGFAYTAKSDMKAVLDSMIPRSGDGLSNLKCVMHVPASRVNRSKRVLDDLAELDKIRARVAEMIAEHKTGKVVYK